MKQTITFDTEHNEFTAVIPCDCHYCGGLVIDGLDIDYLGPDDDEVYPQAYLHVSMWKRLAWEVLPNFWQRIALGFKVMFGSQSLFIDDMVFYKPKVVALRSMLDTALRHWPSDTELSKSRPSLEEIFAKIQKEHEAESETTNG